MAVRLGRRSGIFICYRRGDAAGHARALKEPLVQRFRPPVFMDVDSIPAPADWVKAVEDAICSSAVMLVLIGKDWTGRPPDDNRLDNPGDYVRREVEIALQHNIPIIPILIDRAEMPTPEELPESLRPLVRYEALQLEGGRWKDDFSRLTKTLVPILTRANLPVLSPIALSVPLLIFTLNYNIVHYKTNLAWQVLVATAFLAALLAAMEFRRSRIWVVALECNCLWLMLFGIYKLALQHALPLSHWKAAAAVTLAGAVINVLLFIPALIFVLGSKHAVHPLVPAFLGLMAIGLGIGFFAHFPHHGYLYRAGALVLFAALLVILFASFLGLARRFSARPAARGTQINEPPRRLLGDQTSPMPAQHERGGRWTTGFGDGGAGPGSEPFPPEEPIGKWGGSAEDGPPEEFRGWFRT